MTAATTVAAWYTLSEVWAIAVEAAVEAGFMLGGNNTTTKALALVVGNPWPHLLRLPPHVFLIDE